MPDLIIPLDPSKVPAQVEVRADQVLIVNRLDASGVPGTPGKYQIIIDTVDDVQTAEGVLVQRLRRSPVRFDPMAHASTVIPGTGRTLGQIMGDVLAAVDHFKGGLPK